MGRDCIGCDFRWKCDGGECFSTAFLKDVQRFIELNAHCVESIIAEYRIDTEQLRQRLKST